MEQSTECGDADGHRMDDSVPGTQLPDMMETLMDWAVNMSMATITFKMMSDAYKENPALFWSYMRQKHENLIYHCRM